jgi:hypothetical protein
MKNITSRIGSLGAAVLLNFIMFALPAQAREFYKTNFGFDLSYTSIRTGTDDLFGGSVGVLYSDDADFCYLQIGSEEIPCQISSFDSGDEPTIQIAKALIIKAFLTRLEHVTDVTEVQRSAVKRLIVRFPDEVTIMNRNTSVFYQLDDEQPEAIHIQVSYLRSSVRL